MFNNWSCAVMTEFFLFCFCQMFYKWDHKSKLQHVCINYVFFLNNVLLEKEMATHSSVLAWRIPGTGEPGGLLSMGSHIVGPNWSDLAAAAVLNNIADGVNNLKCILKYFLFEQLKLLDKMFRTSLAKNHVFISEMKIIYFILILRQYQKMFQDVFKKHFKL